MLKLRDVLLFGRLARPLNLLIAGLTYALAAYLSYGKRWAFFDEPAFYYQLWLLWAIMAGGYWINDVFDFKIDRINKPDRTWVGAHISSKKVLTGYIVSVGVVLVGSWLLPYKFIALNYIAVGSLFLYGRFFKRWAVIGNLVVSSLTAAVVLAGAFLMHIHLPLIWLMGFAFLITFIREVTKDIEDIKGDLLFGLRTLPISMGIRLSKRVLLGAYILLILACYLPFVVHYLLWEAWLWGYLYASLCLVQLPLLYTAYRMQGASRPRAFRLQSQLLKLIILGGMASILLLPVAVP